MKPITYYYSLSSDSLAMDEIALRYGSQLETLSNNQKYGLVALLAARSCSPESLPDDLVGLVSNLTQDGGLALIEAVVAQLRHEPKSIQISESEAHLLT